MERLRLAMELLFQRQQSQEGDEDTSLAFERIAREIKGSILALVAIFLLVALTSYLPLDTYNLSAGRLDHINNLGGIVGALVAQWFLGSVGINGYVIVGLVSWLAYSAFQQISLKANLPRIIGAVLGTVLLAITCNLVLRERFEEISLFQGGYVGKHVGALLKLYFNTTGALLLVGGGFVVTLILTTGMSLSRAAASVFDPDEGEVVEIPAASAPRPQLTLIRNSDSEPKTPAKPKRSRKKKSADGENVDEDTENVDGSGEEEGPREKRSASNIADQAMIPYSGSYTIPSLRLLKDSQKGKKLSRGEMKENAEKLCETLLSFQITGEVVHVSQGPVLITYEFKPSAGIKLSKIANLQEDLGIALGTRELRIIAPIPGKSVVGIEVPRPSIDTISLKEVLKDDDFYDKKIRLPVALGQTTDGKSVIGDMAGMPHLLVAGSTGSGKSVFVNSLIMSFLFRLTPAQLRLILVDPKMLEFAAFEGIPHLIAPVITDNAIAMNALNWAVQEMERRYAGMAKTGSKNIDSYNQKMKNPAHKLPFIVVVIDELADLMMSGGQDAELAITRLAQKARAAGIHLVIATQRPSAEVVTGLIKANVPSRISFKVPSGIDSRTILDTSGAEGLIGRGDSLMVTPSIPLRRLHGTFVTEDELARVIKNVKNGRNHSQFYIDFKS